MRTLKLLHELPLAIEGELADEATAAEAARLLDDERDVQEFLSAWLREEYHAAFRIGNQMTWTFRALGRPVMVHWTFTDLDDGDTLDMKVYAYSEEKDAFRDASRLTLKWVLESGDAQIRHMTGWQKDVVMLVRGGEYYSIRTRHTGEIEISGSEDLALAYGNYVEAVIALSNEIEFRGGFPGLSGNPFYTKIAAAFVQREAGQALQAFGRHRLSIGLDAAASMQNMGGPKVNMSELARNLHTDRPNLTRYLGKSSMAGMTAEKLKAEWAELLSEG